jgi:antibiotic biosynthesis monooxygenase (ABM) superfamily enzyme
MDKKIEIDQLIELIRFEVSPQLVARFLENRVKVDEFIKTLTGYISTEISHVKNTEWLMMIRWRNETALQSAQGQTATATVINEWIRDHATFISAETLFVKYVS